MKKIEGGVTAAKGFLAASAKAGIKYQGREDMALVYSEVSAVSAGTFTTNVVKAAPVKWDIKLIQEQEKAHAVVLNSGIANACTGAEGVAVNEYMAQTIATELGIKKEQVLTASTGVIGMQIDRTKLYKGSILLKEGLSDTIEAGTAAAQAIMTTDTICKQCAVEFELGGKTVHMGGMSKGSGMIHPNMATMLGVVTTDAAISKEILSKALSAAVKTSFNMISVDRDTSTNDSYLILANGLAGNAKITEENEDYEVFLEALHMLSQNLAKMMAQDGEGATRLLEVEVWNANSVEEAQLLAKSVITSNLVKTAVFGSDANWGRILCALGYAGVSFDPEKVDLYIESETDDRLQLVQDGVGTAYSEEIASRILSASKVTIIADIKAGEESATAWGCDLTYDYIKINGDYRS